ncbi:16S rRNA C967 or C1407 C5-methylase, RsmB/RsmF family [Cnuella takakiae]|uniref:16S rRNA C967 or C1407 C5-methylase, RsmB/RsmF family n=1 Tax=Cnuella takakiae TaxID=1302690 RepID=A0A1M5B307_9BACT|nr:hypothetical protein [Cnuella takakiae]OLY93304.1 hypothetical protein BUE76_16495 [Cnuella takakiae]SHF36562.1 16S rRNA C967 or C1407 C5-methylase, RsmB/RsmF family [Cnuella takakiae]
MATVPAALIHSLEQLPHFDKEAFIAVHAAEEKVTSVRINPVKFGLEDVAHFSGVQLTNTNPVAVPWSQYGFYLPQRPSFTFDPLFHAGCYYVQEASSMFLEQALLQHGQLEQDQKVLDLCAAPGGKSTHIQSLISAGSLLVSNEVIKARAGILKQNLTRWGAANTVVTNNDPQHFARLAGFFDIMVVDAPCSGSGLFRRDPQAINVWSEDAVQLCCGRQRRILADALPALRSGGLLVYSTCSYSAEEDEAIADWLVQDCGMEPLQLEVPAEWQIVTTSAPASGPKGYRFFPDKTKGEGFYLACFRKKAVDDTRYKTAKPEKASAKEVAALATWLDTSQLEVLKEGFLYALPAHLLEAYSMVKANLYVQQAGIRLGEVMKDKLVPDHALALSGLLHDDVPGTDLSLEDAIRYLQRQDLSFVPEKRGWQTVRYKGHELGWINALGNRLNNYYPKELRILKQGGPDQ